MRNVALPISFGVKRGIPLGVNATRIEIPRHAACLGMNRRRDLLQPAEDFAVFGGAEVRKHPERIKKRTDGESVLLFSRRCLLPCRTATNRAAPDDFRWAAWRRAARAGGAARGTAWSESPRGCSRKGRLYRRRGDREGPCLSSEQSRRFA